MNKTKFVRLLRKHGYTPTVRSSRFEKAQWAWILYWNEAGFYCEARIARPGWNYIGIDGVMAQDGEMYVFRKSMTPPRNVEKSIYNIKE